MFVASSRKRASGFTLVEVLVSVMILSVGLLGLAGLQAFGVKASGSGYYYTQAIALANNMADRMRANPNGISGGGYNNKSAKPSGSNCYDSGGTCSSAAAVANADLIEWYTELANRLPAGNGAIVGVGAATSSVFTIRVMWDDQRTGATGTNCGADPSVDLTCYQLQVRL